MICGAFQAGLDIFVGCVNVYLKSKTFYTEQDFPLNPYRGKPLHFAICRALQKGINESEIRRDNLTESLQMYTLTPNMILLSTTPPHQAAL